MKLFAGEVCCSTNGFDYPSMEEYTIGVSDSFQGCRNIWEEYKAIILKRAEDEGENLNDIVVENNETDLEIDDGAISTNYHYAIISCEMNSLFSWLV